MLGWPKICKLAHAPLWECSYKRLELAQLLGQLGVFLTSGGHHAAPLASRLHRTPTHSPLHSHGRQWKPPAFGHLAEAKLPPQVGTIMLNGNEHYRYIYFTSGIYQRRVVAPRPGAPTKAPPFFPWPLTTDPETS